MVRTQSHVKTIVKQYVHNLRERGIHIEQVVLFGSYTQCHAHDGCDIDLAVITPQFARLNLRERYETLANMTLREPIQAIGYSPNQWRKAERGSFADEIRRTGWVIYRGSGRKVETRLAAVQSGLIPMAKDK